MLAKKITYIDYNGLERTETFYFNLSKAELTKLQFMHPGGYSEHIERIVAAGDLPALMEEFDNLIEISYGEKSEDGKHFVKSPEMAKAFKETEAYSELFTELITESDAAAAFVNGIMPKQSLSESQKAEVAARTKQLLDSMPAEPKE